MNGSGRVRRRRSLLLLAPVVLASIAVPAGRADAEEELTVSPTTVVEGLKTISQAAEEVAEYAAADKNKAQQHAATIEPVWGLIEQTVRGNDQDAYGAFEDAISGLSAAATAGDGKKAASASKALAETAKAYTAKHPAVAPAAASASGSGERKAAAADERKAAAAAPSPDAPAPGAPREAAEVGDANLARTGSMTDALAALAGLALALGGFSIIGGAARRRSSPIA